VSTTSTPSRPDGPSPSRHGVLLPAFQASLALLRAHLAHADGTRAPAMDTFLPASGWACDTEITLAGHQPPGGAAMPSTRRAQNTGVTPAVNDHPGDLPMTPEPWPEGIAPPDGFPAPVPPTTGGPGFGFGEGDPLDTALPGGDAGRAGRGRPREPGPD